MWYIVFKIGLKIGNLHDKCTYLFLEVYPRFINFGEIDRSTVRVYHFYSAHRCMLTIRTLIGV